MYNLCRERREKLGGIEVVIDGIPININDKHYRHISTCVANRVTTPQKKKLQALDESTLINDNSFISTVIIE